MSESFAKRLKVEREAKGWTQSFLAAQIGVSNGTISGYERNYREPDIEMLTKLAEIFDVSIDFLLGKTEQRNCKMVQISENQGEYKTEILEDPALKDLPEAAQRAIQEFISFMKEKYKTK